MRAFERVSQKIAAFEKAKANRNFVYINDCLELVDMASVTCTTDVIIPIYNAYEYTLKCISSVYENTDTDYNLYLINDYSSDKRISSFLENLRKKDRPEHLKKLIISENTSNMGFIKTVNKGIKMSKNHVVLLNTDTEVPFGWLKRLIFPIINEERIASVTPFSNAADICSFPDIAVDNILPKGISLRDVDSIFRQYGRCATVDIPTGVGFCMAMNRDCISVTGVFDPVYGKGYGEENDWCCRAKKNGYRNVMATNLYVYHKHGVSFGELINKNKDKCIKENFKILVNRYPQYMQSVYEFIACDPVGDLRRFIQVIIYRKLHSSHDAELVINHSLGGGASSYILRRIKDESWAKDFFLMELLPDCTSLKITFYSSVNECEFYFNFKQLDVFFLKKLTDCFGVKSIFINHLLGYPLEMILDMIYQTALPYTFVVHDFYCVCPRYNLCNDNYIYCKAEKDIYVCNKCLKNYTRCSDIKDWRKAFYTLLLGAEYVIAPSYNTGMIIKKYYENVVISVVEHKIPNYITKTYSEKFAENKVFHISVLGAIGIEKGSKILYEIIREIRKHQLPIKVTVIGYTDLHGEKYLSSDKMFEVTGKYNNEDVSSLLAVHRTNLVMIPSIVPETYSYTVSEAMYSGYKVVAFNLGAPADRISSTGMGWLVDSISSQSMLCKVKEIMGDVGFAGNNSGGGSSYI